MNPYQQYLKVYRDNQNTMDYAIKEAVEKAVEEAEVNMKKRTEERIKFEHAQVMLEEGMDLKVIAKITGLTEKEIKKLCN